MPDFQPHCPTDSAAVKSAQQLSYVSALHSADLPTKRRSHQPANVISELRAHFSAIRCANIGAFQSAIKSTIEPTICSSEQRAIWTTNSCAVVSPNLCSKFTAYGFANRNTKFAADNSAITPPKFPAFRNSYILTHLDSQCRAYQHSQLAAHKLSD